jgi:integrase
MMAAGIHQRHGRACNGKGRCECPWEAFVYSKRDSKKIRKQFPTKAAAIAWRDDSRSAVRQGRMRAPTGETLREAAKAWVEGAESGLIRNRSGDPYKPAAVRSYDESLKLRVLDEIGNKRLAEITRLDLQDLADGLLGAGLSASTIGVTMLPLRAIYRRAVSRGEITVNPTTGSSCRRSVVAVTA